MGREAVCHAEWPGGTGELADWLEAHSGLAARAAVWVVHGKGGAAFGEAAARAAMRARGFMDNKVSAVSATRYARR